MFILFSIFAAANFFYVVIAKVNSGVFVNSSRSRYALYLTTTALVGCTFLFCLSGFHITLNRTTVLFSLLCSVIDITYLICNALIYRFAKISTVNIITSSAGMIAAALVGRIVFSEPITLTNVIKISIMLVSVAFVYVNALRTTDEKELKRSSAKKKSAVVAFLLVLVLIVSANQGSATLLKFFGRSENVTDERSMFFVSNLVMILVGLSMLTYEIVKNKERPRELVKMFTKKNLVCWVGSTVCANTISIVGVSLLTMVDISIYTMVTAAFGVIISVVASIIFREKLGVFAYLAAALACAAVMI